MPKLLRLLQVTHNILPTSFQVNLG